MNDLTKHEAGAVAIHEPGPGDLLRAVLAQVSNPDVDPARLKEFLEIGERLEARQAEHQFNAAFAQLKTELPVISKKGVVLNKRGTVQFKYARYDDLHRAVTPLLTRHGFSTSFDFEEPEAGRLTTILHLLHTGGFSRDYRWTLPAMGQNQFVSNLQNAAAARSFGKRCVLIDALDILTEDTDSDGAPVAPPDLLTEEQIQTLEDCIAESENRDAGARVRFFKWLSAEYQTDKLSELHQGEQYDAVLGMLKRKLGSK